MNETVIVESAVNGYSLGASIGPTSVLALFWSRTTRAGVTAGLIVGTVVTCIWYYTPLLKGFMYELIPGFTLAFLTTIIVSLLTDPPEDADDLYKSMHRSE